MPLEVQREQNQQDQLHPNPVEEEEENDFEEIVNDPNLRTTYDKVYEMAEKFAATRIGQFVAERGDRILRVIEDTAKWSLPQRQTEVALERPLPWLPFLTMILWLRVIRVWLSVGALLIGNCPVSAEDVVYFIQTRRRKLRAIKIQGAKQMNRTCAEATSSQKVVENTNDGVMANLRKLLTSAICRPGMHYEPISRIYVSHEYEDVGNAKPKRATSGKRPRDDDSNDEDEDKDLTVDQMLNKFANENSDDDSDFIPNINDDTNDESNTSSVSGGSIAADDAEGATNTAIPASPEARKTESSSRQEQNTEQASKNQHDMSIEVRDGGKGNDQMPPMPRPTVEIKKEPLSDLESSSEQSSKTPKANGQGDNRESDVARKSITAIRKLNGAHAIEAHFKTTPGFESAAIVTSRVMPAISTTATAVTISAAAFPPFYDNYHSQHPAAAYSTPTFTYSYDTPSVPTTAGISIATIRKLSNSYNSNSDNDQYSEPTSSSDIDSFVTNEDFDFDYDNESLLVTEHTTDNRRTSMKDMEKFRSYAQNTSSSSSDDDEFYSPAGTPTDFSSFLKPVSILKNPLAGTTNTEPIFTTEAQTSDTSPPAKKIQHQPTPRSNQHNPHRQQNRYRGRNRR